MSDPTNTGPVEPRRGNEGPGDDTVFEAPVEGVVHSVADAPRVDLNEVLREYDPILVSTTPGREFVVVAPRSSEERGVELAIKDTLGPGGIRQRRQDQGPLRTGIGGTTGQVVPHERVDIARGIGVQDEEDMTMELGSAVASPWTAWTRREYNNDLVGYKGLSIYDKMRRSDGTVRGTLRLAKTPVLSANWGIKPASDSVRDKNVARFIWTNLQDWMTMSFPQFITEALLMLDFGYYMFEKVFAHGEDVTSDSQAKGRMVWKKFAPRHPMDVKEWFFDINGGPLSVDMYAPPASGVPEFQGGVIQAYQRWINIPISKLLVFSFDKEAGNIEGISVLRSAYKHWYYKDNLYKIDAIQKERHGIGVPVIVLPMGFQDKDKKLADELGRHLRTNERAHVVLPPNWELTFAELHGNPVDCLPSIEHHDDMIPQSMLGRWMNLTGVGGASSAEQHHTLFLKATRFIADITLDVINRYGIPQLVDYNWSRVGYPKLYAKRIGEQEDWRTESFTIRNFVGSGVITPDDPLEDAIRDRLGLPQRDPNTARQITKGGQTGGGTPKPAVTQKGQTSPEGAPGIPGPPRVGLPRQRQQPGTTSPSTGQGDNSGTSGRRGQ